MVILSLLRKHHQMAALPRSVRLPKMTTAPLPRTAMPRTIYATLGLNGSDIARWKDKRTGAHTSSYSSIGCSTSSCSSRPTFASRFRTWPVIAG
ncbi:unnamed protein product [Zymoseptoria tritici ST99CH_3D7]|uniref:Uncharacterized protein n=1 Tax=Zymoseptoria tritici (strain ST99CH_3D7) TaxID=1276538 RepID=A0A1X7SA06_ZYMT9|nr:unnamed protein product [Zymoseptoria tritici ST99CH_3D7]